jgi:hypothetical protein
MKLHQTESIALALVAAAVVAAGTVPEPDQGDSETIRFGLSQSELILSGKLDGTFMGGGAATSQVVVNEVLKAPKGFQTPKTVAVYWLSDKDPGNARHTNSFLFFLRPASTNANTGYHDVTGKSHPFVLASDVNVRFLRSEMLKEK